MSEIALIVPRTRTHYRVPPIGLGYLAASLRSAGIDSVTIIDALRDGLSPKEVASRCEADGVRIAGIQFFSADINEVRAIASAIRASSPGTVILLGGPHVSAVGADLLEDVPEADLALAGEAERGIVLLASGILGGGGRPDGTGIPGLISRDGTAEERAFVDPLDDLPLPAWDLMRPDSYPPAPQGAVFRRYPIAPVASTRGCPYDCAFCGSPTNMGRHLRRRSLDHLFRELEILHGDYGVREFHFIDDAFNLDPGRVLEFCRRLDSSGMDISYTFPNGLRLNPLTGEVLEALRETGAYAFTVGIESGSDRVLAAMRKGLTTELVREKVNLIASKGIEVSGFFLLGFPTETREEMEETIRFARSLPLARAHFSNFLPLPGTPATNELIERGEIGKIDWSELFYSETPYAPEGMTREELKGMQRKAFLSFHLRPRQAWKIIKEMRSPRQVLMLMERAWDYLFGRRS